MQILKRHKKPKVPRLVHLITINKLKYILTEHKEVCNAGILLEEEKLRSSFSQHINIIQFNIWPTH